MVDVKALQKNLAFLTGICKKFFGKVNVKQSQVNVESFDHHKQVDILPAKDLFRNSNIMQKDH